MSKKLIALLLVAMLVLALPLMGLAAEEHTHSWGKGVTTTKRTCLTDGVKTYTCKICGETKTAPYKHFGHAFTEWYVNPSNTIVGMLQRDCIYCEKEEYRYIPPVYPAEFPVAEVLTAAVADLGEDATLNIQNMDQIFAAEDMEKLNALSAQDKMAVVLKALGFAAEDQALSEEAAALEEVDADKAAVEKNFPSCIIVMKEAGDYEAPYITLVKDGAEETYGFLRVKNVWSFEKLGE